MVHALREARRVLKPGGLLIDLRPAVEYSRVGILRAGRFTELGRTCGSLDGARAADRAVSRLLAKGIFHEASRDRIECDVVFASARALRKWLVEFEGVEGAPTQEKAVQRAAEASRRGRSKIVVRIRLVMRILNKHGADARRRAQRSKRLGRDPASRRPRTSGTRPGGASCTAGHGRKPAPATGQSGSPGNASSRIGAGRHG